jgi:hypothetical protein
MQYYLTDSDRRIVSKLISDYNSFKHKPAPQKRRRGKIGGKAGVVGEMYQLIRGTVTYPAAEETTDYDEFNLCYITDIIELEENAIRPSDDPVAIAISKDETLPAEGDIIWAAYHKAIMTLEYEGEIDWLKIPTGIGGGGGVLIVLIDKEIPGTKDFTPSKYLIETDILSQEEIESYWEVIFQDPPDPDDPNANNVEKLELLGYKRLELDLKYYEDQDILLEGECTVSGTDTTIILAEGADTQSDFYNGDIITLVGGAGAGDVRTITDYDGALRTVTVSVAWTSNPSSGTQYEITSDLDLVLATEIETDAEYLRKIVRHKTRKVFYDDGEKFQLGTYEKADYSNYPEDELFPPDGTGTYMVEEVDFFKERYRGMAVKDEKGDWVLVTSFCKRLPPRPLRLAGS